MSAIQSAPSTARRIAALALEIALAYSAAGTREEGGNNRGDQVEFFQRLMGGAPGDPWCADFVCSCLVKAFARSRGLPEDRDRLPGYRGEASSLLLPLSGSCAELAAAARARGRLKPPEFAALPGDLVLFDFENSGRPGHVGLVRSVDGGLVHTVEGNTSSGVAGSQVDGGGVFKRMRSRAAVYGLVHFG